MRRAGPKFPVVADLSDFTVMSFDCYGTMIDWEAGILGRLGPWLIGAGAAVGDGAILAAFAAAESQVESEHPEAPYPNVLGEVHRRIAAHFGVDPDPDAAEAFATSVPDWPAFPDSHDALARLGSRYRLVVLSNVDRSSFQGSKDRLGIRFDAVYTAEDIGSYKPDPRNFDHLVAAESAAGYDRSVILHVGQSLFHDHAPASAAGLATCWIQRPSPAGELGATRPPDVRPAVDFHFTSLAELADAAVV